MALISERLMGELPQQLEGISLYNYVALASKKIHIECKKLFIGWRSLPANPPSLDYADIILNGLFTECMFHFSSAKVYVSNRDIFFENDFEPTLSEVTNSKQELEHFFTHKSSEKSCNLVNFRISNVYGDGIPTGFITSLFHSIERGITQEVFLDPELVRDYVSVEDVVKMVIGLSDMKHAVTAINISSGVGTSVSQIINLVKSVGIPANLFKEVCTPKELILKSVLSRDRAHKLFPFSSAPLSEYIVTQAARRLG